jgi:O-antigen/teichoic acid export membrane protein
VKKTPKSQKSLDYPPILWHNIKHDLNGWEVDMINKRYRNLFRNTVIFGIGIFGSKLLVFFLLPLYTAYLTPEMFSAADLISQLSNLLIPLACLGITDGVFRFAMDREQDRREVFTTGFTVLLVGSLIFALLSPLLCLSDAFRDYAWLIVCYVLAADFHSLCAQYLRAQGKTALFAVQGIINTALTILLNIIFLIPLRMGVLGYILSVVVADTLMTLFLFLYARLYRDLRPAYFRRATARAMLAYSIPMIPTTVFWWITSVSDRYLVDHFSGATINGLYSAAYKIPTLLTLLCTVFIEAWQLSAVRDSEAKEERIRFFSEVFLGFQGLMFLACSGLIAFAQIGTNILFADSYAEAWVYIPVLLIATVYSSLVTYFGSVYFVAKKSVLSFLTAMLGAVTNIVLNLLLIPTYGAQGAALATLVSYWAVYLLRAVNTRRHLPFRQYPIRVAVNTLLVGAQAVAMILRMSGWIWIQVGAILLIFAINVRPMIVIVLRRLRGRRRTEG